MLKKIKFLLLKDIKKNFDNPTSLFTITLNVICSSYIVYVASFGIIDNNSWITFFWIIIFFSSINATYLSFENELKTQALFYHFLFSSKSIILSKVIFNSLILILISILNLICFTFFFGNPLVNTFVFGIGIFLSSISLASILSLISGISIKSNNGNMLMTVLSLPILFPLLLNLIKLSEFCMQERSENILTNEIYFLLLLNVVTISLCYILFPYLCKN